MWCIFFAMEASFAFACCFVYVFDCPVNTNHSYTICTTSGQRPTLYKCYTNVCVYWVSPTFANPARVYNVEFTGVILLTIHILAM